MIIQEVRIDSFATLRNKEFAFSDGLQIAEEYRSTLAMFLKFMLYGLSDRPAEGELSEIQKYINTDTRRAAGILLLDYEERTLQIERILMVGNTAKELCRIVDAETGGILQQGSGLQVGKILFGICEKCFVSTVFAVPQDGTDTEENILTSVDTLLATAHGDTSPAQAIAKLEEARRALLDESGSLGRIAEKRAERQALAEKYTEAKKLQDTQEISTVYSSSAVSDTLSAEILRQEKIVSLGEISLRRQHFDKLHIAEKQIIGMREEIARMREELSIDRFMSEISENEKNLEENITAIHELEQQIEDNISLTAAAIAKQKEIDEAKEKALAEAKQYRRQETVSGTVYKFLLVLAIIFIVAFFVSVKRNNQNITHLLILFGVFLMGSMTAMSVKSYLHAKYKKFLHTFDTETVEDLPTAVADSLGGEVNMSLLEAEMLQLNHTLTEEKEKLHATATKCYLLAREIDIEYVTGDESDEKNYITQAAIALANARSVVSEQAAEIAKRTAGVDEFNARVEGAREQLAPYSEEEIRRSFKEAMETQEGRLVCNIDSYRLDKAKQKLADLQKRYKESTEISAENGTPVPPSVTPSETVSLAEYKEALARLDTEISDMLLCYEAYTLAIQTLGEQCETI